MRRSERQYPEDEANKLGLLLNDPALMHNIENAVTVPSPHQYTSLVAIDEGIHRIKTPTGLTEIENWWGGDFNWNEHWRRLSFETLRTNFSTDELYRMMHNSCIMSEVSEEFHYNPLYRLLHKVSNTFHHWSSGKRNYNHYVYFYMKLKQFKFPFPDTEVRLDYSTYYNPNGYSQYTRTYIDGPLAYMIYHKGKHVLTIGFVPTTFGVVITQVQLKQPKGNRWLFQLPCHYLEFAIQQMAELFHDTRLYLAEGNSMLHWVKSQYGKDLPQYEKHINSERIVSFYNMELNRFSRYPESHNATLSKGIECNRLYDNQDKLSLEWADQDLQYKPYVTVTEFDKLRRKTA